MAQVEIEKNLVGVPQDTIPFGNDTANDIVTLTDTMDVTPTPNGDVNREYTAVPDDTAAMAVGLENFDDVDIDPYAEFVQDAVAQSRAWLPR